MDTVKNVSNNDENTLNAYKTFEIFQNTSCYMKGIARKTKVLINMCEIMSFLIENIFADKRSINS